MTGALSFLHPSEAGDTAAAGILQGHGGRIVMATGHVALRQSLLLLLSTRPGERVGRPDYGCALDRLAFEPNDATTAGMAIRLIADAVALCEPRAEILQLDAEADVNDPAVLRVRLTYRDRRSDATGSLDIPVDLGGSP